MATRVPKCRISTLLVERQLLPDEKTATAWVLAGKVLADGRRVDKPGDLVPTSSDIRVRGLDNPYVSRGGLKLRGALAAFGVDPTGRVALDCGASTGGFTDCLLQHGASRVYSVDVGHGQLDWRLQTDSRVVNLEKVNISDVTQEMLLPPPTLAVADLSYLSLRTAIPIIAPLVSGAAGTIIALVKPLFELERGNAIESMAEYLSVLRGLVEAVGGMGLGVLGVVDSPIRGSSGTVEFFIHLNKDASNCAGSGSLDEQMANSVARALGQQAQQTV